jgi:internalin A
MQKQRTIWQCLAALAVLASCGPGVFVGAEPGANGAPKPLPPEIVKAWREAGADVGWMKDAPPKPSSGYGYWEPFREKGEAGAVPAFRYHPDKEGVPGKLPDPGVPFGLDTHCCAMKDAEFKQLAGLKSLQSLNLGGALLLTDTGLKELAQLKNLQALYLFYAHVTDAGLKELAGLKNLQVLDLSHTQVTYAGLKELAGLKSLQWVNLHRAEVTAVGIAALQKELPKCKIVTGDD